MLNNKKDEHVKKVELITSLFLYGILTLLFFNNIFSEIYLESTGDSYYSFYSWNTFFRDSINRGIFPLWNPLVLCGHPYASSISNFSLSNILLLFLDVNCAWNVKLFFSTVFSGWFMFLLLRKYMHISWCPAFLAGFIFMFLSPNITDEPFLYLPLIFIFANKWISTRKFLWMFVLATTISVFFINANPQIVLYFCFFAYVYILLSFINKEDSKNRKILPYILKTSIPFLIALGLSSFRIFPMLEMLHISHRETIGALSYVLLPTHLISLLYSKFLMGSSCPDLNFFPARILNGISFYLFGHERLTYASAPYIGVLPFVLALVVIVKRNKSFLERFFVYSSIIIILYVMLNPVLSILTQYIPVLGNMPFICRSYMVYNFSMVILVAIAIENLFTGKPFELKAAKRLFLPFFLFLVILVLFRLIIYIVLLVFDQNILYVLTNNILPYVLEQSFYKASPEFYYNRLEQFIVFLRCWASPANSYFLVPTILLIFSLVLLLFYLRRNIQRYLFTVLATIIIFADLFLAFGLPSYPPKEIVKPFKVVDYISEQPGVFRVMPLMHDYDIKNPSVMDTRTFLRPESSMLYNIMTPEGYRSLWLDRYADIIGLLTGEPSHSLRIRVGEFDKNKIDDKIVDLLNVKYIVTSADSGLNEGYTLVYKDEIHKLFENEDVLPRVFLVHNVKMAKQKNQILYLLKSDIDYSSVVLLEDEDVGLIPVKREEPDKESKVLINKYEPNYIQVSVENPKDGFLVFLDCYHPGWKSTVDGRHSKIYKANYAFRAVKVPEGRHVIEFSYRPNSLKLGFLVSFAFLFSGLAACFFLREKV